MTEYKVVTGNIIVNGVVHTSGAVIELTDEQGNNLSRYIKPTGNNDQTKREEVETVDYNELTLSELESMASELDIKVIGTGKNGRTVKKDYVAALENQKK
ncbi:hypothetical protein KRP69_01560 [Mammaliicoccus sciuri]|uniref:hypothetical protein n=1 Tax=Mammaliicoccus sciuri TaxID=1296 RepID=UPI001D0CF8E3|nr:hypothetical protein [Mammaliicoccus sciuri]MCC2087891.1 hypothetical protein [Mammaliicoccus sciuri]